MATGTLACEMPLAFLKARQSARCEIGAVAWVSEREGLMKSEEYQLLRYMPGSMRLKEACTQVKDNGLDPTNQMKCSF